MKRIHVLALVVAIGAVGCAAYNKCVKPEITAATKLAPSDLLREVSAFLLCGGPDLPDLAAPCAVKGLADLALALGPGGEEAVNCLVSYLEENASDPVIKARAKAVGAKRGVTPELFNMHACNGLQAAPGGSAPGRLAVRDFRPEKAGNGNAAQTAFRAGESGRLDGGRDRLTIGACDAKCGGRNTSIAPPSGCRCHVGAGRSARWVAAR